MSIQITKTNKIAILFGASGLVGGHCLNFLLASPIYDKVLVFGRKLLDLEHEKLEQQIINFDDLASFSDLVKGDDLFFCMGTTMKKAGNKENFKRVDYTYAHQIAEIGAKHKINQLLLVSAVGADKDSLFYYNQIKGALEDEVKLMPYWAIHIFQPSILLGERNEDRWGESIAQKIGRGIDQLTGGLLSKYKPVEADVVGKAMVNAAQKLEKGIHVYPSHFLQKMAEEANFKIQSRRDH